MDAPGGEAPEHSKYPRMAVWTPLPAFSGPYPYRRPPPRVNRVFIWSMTTASTIAMPITICL